jgi:hypothetical protein
MQGGNKHMCNLLLLVVVNGGALDVGTCREPARRKTPAVDKAVQMAGTPGLPSTPAMLGVPSPVKTAWTRQSWPTATCAEIWLSQTPFKSTSALQDAQQQHLLAIYNSDSPTLQ